MVEREVVIELKDVWAGYNHVPVLEAVTLNVYRDDYLAILGPNGGGKTTLLRTILGLLKPWRGEVRVLGLPPEEARTRIGYVPQVAQFDRDFPISVWDVVLMGRLGRLSRFSRHSKDDIEATRQALEAVEMLDFKDRHISDLSGGQKQRVFIARALATQPEILLLDEPAASLDRMVQQNLYDLLRELNSEITIVMVTHDIGVISSYVKRVACLNRRLVVHDEKGLTKEEIEGIYACPIDLIAHGVPHRVFGEHE